METASSSSPGSRSRSSGSSTFLPVKPEPQETPLGWRMRNVDLVINEPNTSYCLVKPKTEPRLLPVKQEHLAMAAADETALNGVAEAIAVVANRHGLGDTGHSTLGTHATGVSH
ncbi:SEC12-like protein 2 [Hordeum vulgare]|nr:SEC12-like protein 2 [Hordeum vulgare]